MHRAKLGCVGLEGLLGALGHSIKVDSDVGRSLIDLTRFASSKFKLLLEGNLQKRNERKLLALRPIMYQSTKCTYQ